MAAMAGCESSPSGPRTNKIDVQTYSPSLKEYKKEPKSEFSLAVDFTKLPARPPAK